MASETNTIVEETNDLAGHGFPVDPVLRILWRGTRKKGACCYDDGGDTVCNDSLSHFACDVLSGTFVPHATCADDPCTVGACCCPDDPGCFITSQADCEACCPECEFQGEGSECDPNPCGGACCGDDGCFDALDETDCIDSGGAYRGDGVVCDSEISPCGACCYTVDGETICDDSLSDTECSDLSGEFFQGDTCGDAPCRGACCEDDGATCEDLSASDCNAASGEFRGIDTTCSDDPDPCACGDCPDPDDEDVAINFSGVAYCGCITLPDDGGSIYVSAGSTDINTAFGLDNIGSGHWQWTGSGLGHVAIYSSSDCSGEIVSEHNTNPDLIDVHCDDGGLLVVASSSFGTNLFFSNDDVSSACDSFDGVYANGGHGTLGWRIDCENTTDSNLDCCVPPPTCASISVEFILSGTVGYGVDDCAFPDSIVISADSSNSVSGTCTISDSGFIDYTCPSSCDPRGPFDPPESWNYDITVALHEDDHWYLTLGVDDDDQGFCGLHLDMGTAITDYDLGTSGGSFSIEFDDPNVPTIHYDFEVTVTF